MPSATGLAFGFTPFTWSERGGAACDGRQPPPSLVIPSRQTLLCAVRAEEDELRRLVIGQIGRPALGVDRQPRPLALGALEDGCGTFSAHPRQEVTRFGTI